MAIYKIVGDKEDLVEIESTTFGQEGVLERSDLQRLLRDKPEVIEDKLLIISEEFGDWEDSNRRIDLLALDATGRLTVIELKRGETGEHMDLQALRYAAMVANMTRQQAVNSFQTYLKRRAADGGDDLAPDEAERQLGEHVGTAEDSDQTFQSDFPRIILVSEGFSKELTTCVMWLNDSWLNTASSDITCVQLQLHKNGSELLLETKTLIPLPEASGYRTQIAEKQREERVQKSGRPTREPGAEAFKEQIAKSLERFQPDLLKLHDAAVRLQQEGLAELFTHRNRPGNYFRIEPVVKGEAHALVSFNLVHFARGVGEISVWPGWEDWAPAALARMDEVIGTVTSDSGARHRRLSIRKTSDALDTILDIIHDAYQEAREHHLEGENGEAQ